MLKPLVEITQLKSFRFERSSERVDALILELPRYETGKGGERLESLEVLKGFLGVVIFSESVHK